MRRRLRELRLIDALMLSAVPLLVALYLVVEAALAYRRDIQFDDWWSARASVLSEFNARVQAFRNLPAELRLARRLDAGRRDAGVIRLSIPTDAWTRLWTDPQLYWGQWQEATLVQDGGVLPAKLRKRGDNSVHWSTEKHTMTVRTPREEFYKRYRAFGLSVKDPLTAWLANRLAGDFGLLAPTTSVVPVFINNQYAGVYRFIETVDESFLRPFDRMPGNIYRADAAERSDYFKGLQRDVFSNPYIWDRVAKSDRATGPGTVQLRRFLEDINGTTFADHQRLMARLDGAELSRLLAYLLLVGDPYHMDAIHNQMWYEDISTGLLHPIPWDVRVLDLRRQDQRLSPVFRALLRDPFLPDAILREVHRRLDGGFVAQADSLMRGVVARYPDAIAYDRLRGGLIPDPGDPDEAVAKLRGNAAELTRWLDDAVVAVATGAAPGGVTVLDAELRGYAGVDLTAIELPGSGAPAVFLDRNGDGLLDAGDPAVPGRTAGGVFTPATPVALYAGWRSDTLGVRPGRLAYRLFIRGATGALTPRFTNRVTGAAVTPVAWDGGVAIAPSRTWSPWRFPVHRGATHVWRGTLRFTETVRIPAGDTLVVEPGTVLRLAPDVSVVSRGPVFMRGTRERPIDVVPDQPGTPWGTFSMFRHGADNSRITWTRFFYGGGALVDGVEFTGMVNLQRADNVHLRHVTFERNVRSDDTFHAIHSTFVLDSSHFINTNADAVDLDISTGVIANNLFENTGGDALDLMTSTPLIYGNVIHGASDKGVSVGEASAPLIFNNEIRGTRRGIEVKDRSTPVILNNLLVDNGVGVYQDRKNWRYGGGGWATVANTRFEGNGKELQGDVFSRLTLGENPGLDTAIGAGAAWFGRRRGAAAEHSNLAWLYALYGLPASADTAVLVPGVTPGTPVTPLAGQVFQDDFGAYADGWERSPAVQRLYKRRDALIAGVESRPGTITLPVDWVIPPGERVSLSLEAATTDIDSLEVEVSGPGRTLRRPVELTGDPALFRVTTLDLPPGHYTALALRVVPRPRVEKVGTRTGLVDLKPGQLHLRGWQLVRIPSPGAAPAAPAPEGR